MNPPGPQIGEILGGRFRLDAVLGQGGFGAVYRATDVQTGDGVALKVLRGDRVSPTTLARFEREMHVVGMLTSPHTVRLLGVGATAQGAPFAAFELLPGRDLAEVLRAGPIPVEAAERVLRQVLESLDEAHGRGVLHRDIKPENIRLLDDPSDPWRVKLLDFGVARVAGPQTAELTAAGELVGTPRYMSPEQLTEQSITPASDLYSLGIVLLEMLSGSAQLHGGELGDQMERMREGHVFRLPEGVHARPALARVLAALTARAPGERPPSAAAVLAMLGERPRTMVPVVSQERPSSRRAVLVLVGSAAALACILFIAWTRPRESPPTPPPRATVRVPPSLVNSPAPPQPSPTAIPGDAGNSADPDPQVKSLAEGLQVVRWTEGLDRREALAYLPAGYDVSRQWPVVFVFHEARQTPDAIRREVALESLADELGFVLVFPEGIQFKQVWLSQRKANRPWEDPARALNIVGAIHEHLSVDRQRYFAIGHEQGAVAALGLACEGLFAAIATTAFRAEPLPSCAVPLLTIEPTRWAREPADGGMPPEVCRENRKKLSIAEHERRLRALHKCTGPENEVARATYGARHRCAAHSCGVPLETCRVDGGRHWPNFVDPEESDPCAGEPSDFPYGQVILAFFQANGLASPAETDPTP